MKAFPLFLNVVDRPVVIVGGGEQAAQKARLAGKTDARLVLMAPALVPELAARVAGGARHVPAVVDNGGFRGAPLAFVCTGCAGADAAIAAVAQDLGVLVNVVDRPDLCDVTTPAIVDRDPVVVAIGTEGTAPVLARQIKTALETLLEPSLGAFAAQMGRLRPAVERAVPRARRRAFWEWAFDTPRRLFTGGDTAAADRAIAGALQAGGPPSNRAGLVSLVDVAHGEADLMTLRAVARLQSADLIVHQPAVPAAILELARRDAERFATPSLRDALPLVRETAEAGDRVVLLSTHLPTETMAFGALQKPGLAVEVVGPLPATARGAA
ncbi:MAG: NAD(P)-dependent oxidoreductase [Pseudomonadota bacterium]